MCMNNIAQSVPILVIVLPHSQRCSALIAAPPPPDFLSCGCNNSLSGYSECAYQGAQLQTLAGPKCQAVLHICQRIHQVYPILCWHVNLEHPSADPTLLLFPRLHGSTHV